MIPPLSSSTPLLEKLVQEQETTTILRVTKEILFSQEQVDPKRSLKKQKKVHQFEIFVTDPEGTKKKIL